MNPRKLFAYNRLISDPDYVEDVFCPKFIQHFREEFKLGAISDKNIHNLLISLFYTFLTGNAVPIWRKDFSRLFGSKINKRKSEFFTMSGYTTQRWRGKRVVRHGKSRRYMARPEIMDRIIDTPLQAFSDAVDSDLWYDVYGLLYRQPEDWKIMIAVTYFFVTNPITAFRRGAGAIPFTVLGHEVTETIIKAVLKSRHIIDDSDGEFGVYTRKRYPKMNPLRRLTEAEIASNKQLGSIYDLESLYYNARALWVFDQLRNAQQEIPEPLASVIQEMSAEQIGDDDKPTDASQHRGAA